MRKTFCVVFALLVLAGVAFAGISVQQTGRHSLQVSFSSRFQQARIWIKPAGNGQWQIYRLNYGSGNFTINNLPDGTYEIKVDGDGSVSGRGGAVPFNNRMKVGECVANVSGQSSGGRGSTSSSSSIHVDVHCITCNGSGKCRNCNGKGEYYKSGVNHGYYKCDRCNGSGKCPYCNGTGRK